MTEQQERQEMQKRREAVLKKGAQPYRGVAPTSKAYNAEQRKRFEGKQ